MMPISVSVIIPVYNVAQYLPACLDSILSQTLSNVEIICINDSSPDSSREILAAYAERDDRLVIQDHDQNRGLAAARNTGLDFCSGEYVFFLDSDDILFSEDSLARLFAIAKRDDADEVVGATLRWYEQTGEKVYDYHKDYLLENLASVRFEDFPLLRHNAIACNKLLRRSFLEEHGLRFENDLRKFEDNVFSWKAHLLARSISLTLEPTYLHRIRPGDQEKSIMQYKGDDVENHVRAVGYMLDFLKGDSRFTVLRHYFDRYFFTWCYLDVQELAGRNPTDRRKIELLNMYLPVLVQVPTTSLVENIMPGRYRKGLQLMQQEQFAEAWQVFVVENFQASCQQGTVAGTPGPRSSLRSRFLGKMNGLLKKIAG